MNTVITISRQFGSGGRLIGKMLARKLGIPFYDKEIIEQASEKSGLAQEFIKENEQKRKGISSYAIPTSAWGGAWSNFDNLEARIYASEAEAIEKFAKQGPCVIVGRCADYVLKGKYRCLNVFIHSDTESRIKRIIEVYGDAKDKKKAQKIIKDADKSRARHYKYYTDAEWGGASNYHLCVNSAAFGVDRCVELLAESYAKFDAEQDGSQNGK